MNAGDAQDIDGSIDEMIVQSVDSGTLLIGPDAATATAFNATSNNRINAINHAYWTPALNINTPVDDKQFAFSVFASDDDGSTSAGAVAVEVTVSDVNDAPILSTFTDDVGSTAEDTEVELRFSDIMSVAKATDVDGSIDALAVNSVVSGSLRIGTSAATATAFSTVSNNLITAATHAYWTPDPNVNTPADGPQSAFTAVVLDNDNTLSSPPVTATIQVTDVNDSPTLTALVGSVDNTDEDTEVQVTFAELTATGNDVDIDGSVDALIVTQVISGNLRIGYNADTAQPWQPGSNDTIDAGNHAWWTPAINANTTADGRQYAFSVVAQDNDGGVSAEPVQALVRVHDVNDNPQLNATAQTATPEDTLLTLDLEMLQSLTGASDADGTVDAIQIESSTTGTLLIGAARETALPFAAGENDTINTANRAYWLPDEDTNTTADGLTGQLSLLAIDNDRGISESASALTITILPVNDSPAGTDHTVVLNEDNNYTLRIQDFGFSDDKDNHQLTAIVVTNLPVNGNILLDGVALAAGALVDATDIEDGLLVFSPWQDTYGESEAGLGFRVQDNGGTDNGGVNVDQAANTIHFAITPVNDAPTLRIEGIVLDEGAVLTLDSALINGADTDDDPAALTYTLNQPPANGELTLDQIVLTTGGTFTAQDIYDGRLSYRHDGSETDSDSFTVALADGGEDNAAGTTESAQITINEVIDAAPVINDLTVRLEYAQAFDTTEQPESALLYGLDANFTVEIVTQPLRGEVELQEDGHYTYRHNGGLILQDRFTYRVTNEDGISSEATVNIGIEPPFLRALPSLISAVTASEPEPQLEEPAPPPAAAAKPEATETQAPVPAPAPQAAAQEQIFQDNAFTRQEPDKQPATASTTLVEPVQIALANNDFFRDESDFIDKVIQHRQWNIDRLSVSTDIASISSGVNLNGVKLNDLFRMDFRYAESKNSKMAEQFDEQRELMRNTVPTNFEFGTKAITVSSGLSIGYLVWLIRGGVLLGSVMSSMPAWRTFDPLPVLNGMSAEDEDGESLESLVEEDTDDDLPDNPDKKDKTVTPKPA
ncbi:MAG: Ig-like domain-containing protein [Pseudomonadota bacterium]